MRWTGLKQSAHAVRGLLPEQSSSSLLPLVSTGLFQETTAGGKKATTDVRLAVCAFVLQLWEEKKKKQKWKYLQVFEAVGAFARREIASDARTVWCQTGWTCWKVKMKGKCANTARFGSYSAGRRANPVDLAAGLLSWRSRRHLYSDQWREKAKIINSDRE